MFLLRVIHLILINFLNHFAYKTNDFVINFLVRQIYKKPLRYSQDFLKRITILKIYVLKTISLKLIKKIDRKIYNQLKFILFIFIKITFIEK